MSQALNRPQNPRRAEYRVPVPHRSATMAAALITIGALMALVGVYFQFAPASWWLAHLPEAYHLWTYVVGGLTAATGFGVYANRSMG